MGLNHTCDDDCIGHCQSRWHFACRRVLVFVVGQKIVLTMDLSLLKQSVQQCCCSHDKLAKDSAALTTVAAHCSEAHIPKVVITRGRRRAASGISRNAPATVSAAPDTAGPLQGAQVQEPQRRWRSMPPGLVQGLPAACRSSCLVDTPHLLEIPQPLLADWGP